MLHGWGVRHCGNIGYVRNVVVHDLFICEPTHDFFFHFTVITLSVADSVHLDTRRHIRSLQGFHKFLNIPTRLTVKTEVTLFSIKSYVLGLQIFLMGGAWIDFLFDKQTII